MKNFVLGMLGGFITLLLAVVFYIIGVATGYSIAKPATYKTSIKEVK